MARSMFVALALVLALAGLGCGGTPAGNDAGTSGSDAGRDAAMVAADAGNDGGSTPTDTGPADMGADTGPTVCPTTFAGCTTLEDHTTESSVIISITGFAYTPNCIRIHTGTTVTMPAAGIHPLTNATCSPTGSPIPSGVTAATTDVTFTTAGAYGYYCANHGTNAGVGMAGLIIVE